MCMCLYLSACVRSVAKGGSSICLVKNGWITVESGSEEIPWCMLHMIIHIFSACALM